jgi:ATP-binding cassette, subfamily C, bacterial
VLVLDEATSALDAETERRVHEGLRRRGCSCVVIAHRLSAIRQCDQILLVDDGRIVSRGTHAELWNTDAAYRNFFRGGAA